MLVAHKYRVVLNIYHRNLVLLTSSILNFIDCNILLIAANATAKCMWFAVWRMLASQWATSWTWAFWKLSFRFPSQLLTNTLPFVTACAEMSGAPAKPRSHRAAELALKFNEAVSMLSTRLLKALNTSSRGSTSATHQLFPPEVFIIVRY